MRPQSLAEVAERSLQGAPFDLCLKNFLDGFYAAPAGQALAVEPPRLAASLPELGLVRDAYLAAVAESLAAYASVTPPAWAFTEERKLRRPWFALPFASLRAVLLWESPPAFRSRNLFVSENALSRV
jgi:hypothetical protein